MDDSADVGAQRPTEIVYHIRVKGHLSAAGAAWFDGLTVVNETVVNETVVNETVVNETVVNETAGGEAVLSGPMRDQAALMAALHRVHDLGLTLVSVTRACRRPGHPSSYRW